MFEIVRKITKAPLTYLADLRKLTFKEYLLSNTKFSPSYPIMISTSLLLTLALAILMIIDIFTLQGNHSCFANVRYGAYVISILYPIQTVLFFICITGSIALSKSGIWRLICIVLFGPLVCGFGFGQMAFIEMCLLSQKHKDSFNVIGLFKEEAFIDSMVYLYISFVLLYIILLPIFDYLYKRQKEDHLQQQRQQKRSRKSTQRSQKEDKGNDQLQTQPDSHERTCCDRCICVIYYIVVLLFAFSIIFIAFIKLIGPILYTYILVELTITGIPSLQSKEKAFYALCLTAYVAPLFVANIVFLIQKICLIAKRKVSFEEGEPESINNKTVQLEQETNRRNSDTLRETINRSRQNTQKQEQIIEPSIDQNRVSKSQVKRSIRDTLL